MINIDELILHGPFSLTKEKKKELYKESLFQLTIHHKNNCTEYKKIYTQLHKEELTNISLYPFIPVRLFKKYELKSISDEKIFKTMTSSGTSGQQVSKIFLDKYTASLQTKALAKILSEFIGKKRLPMLIIDTKKVLKDRNSFSARGAGILGFTLFGFDVTYVLDEDMNIDFEVVENFLDKHQNEDIFIFGFTSIIWEHFHKPLINNKKKIDINRGILLHGGGWKKLQNEAVDSKTFKELLNSNTGIKRIHNYYGMIEQTGSIFMECEKGHFHCSDYSDIEIINKNFETCEYSEKGLVKLYSLLPYSYPGHIILTEDSGEIIGEDDCSCGRLGKYFKIHGRVKNAEVRGCSDTYESKNR